jgi:glycogen synthase
VRAVILTNEFPPNVYGGAGVHVAELTSALRGQIELDIRTFGDQHDDAPGWRVRGYPAAAEPVGAGGAPDAIRPVLGAFSRNLAMVADPIDADLVHCHTWYTHLGGVMASQAMAIPLVVTVHSLEPMRPWKREQLGGGYEVSAWIERQALERADAVIAVSSAAREEVLEHFATDPARLHVVHNGVDSEGFAPDPSVDALARHGVDRGAPYVLFVGRITRQKGITTLISAIRHLDPGIGVVLAAGQADTPELAAEFEAGVAAARAAAPDRPIHWIPEQLDRPALRQFYSHASLFACPSVYEPFGITNLEAMACGVPVVGSRVGGIPEIVLQDQTGLLVEPHDDPLAWAAAINQLVADPSRRASMGAAGRQRAIEHFSWAAVAERTVAVYRQAARSHEARPT